MGYQNQQYKSIPDEEKELNVQSNLGLDPVEPPHSHRRFPASTVGLLCLVGVCATIMLGFATSTNRGQALSRQSALAPADVPIRGEAFYVRPCIFAECYASSCDPASAPYTCLFHNGGPHGGCSAVKWTKESCDVQCDLSHCDLVPIPNNADTCKGVACGDEWCAGDQKCPGDVPFQCTNGSARFGCSMDEFQWAFKTSGSTCSSCCDTTTCE